ncbi:MAG: glutamate--tRNA ligase family protein [Fibrobacteraceae bacterium]|nr:glutamate--tRNA ligase family protein [Fibrobacteraceae bacterium]
MNPDYPYTRFAPSPTGYLHRGHILSALWVYACAKKFGYKVRLRIEDHDKSRARPEYIDSIREDLEWLGFSWDAESIQSSHEERFEKALELLKEKGLVYSCNCSRKFTFENNPVNGEGEIIYQGLCRERNLPFSRENAIRFKISDKTVEWDDLRLGHFAERPAEQCGDFALRDRTGLWTYQFAVAVDDFEEKVGLVVRGEDLRNSTARQIELSEALGRAQRPLFLHHPLITDTTGKKLSKRKKSTSIRGEKQTGKKAEEIIGEVCFEAGISKKQEQLSINNAISLLVTQLTPKF